MSNWHEELHRRLSGLELGAHREMSIVDEIAQHLDDRVRVLMAEGLTVAEAEAAALADLDLPGEFEKRLAEVEPRRPASLPPPGAPSRARLVASLWQDVRYGIRSLRRAPGPVLAVVAALALTVGPTTATLGVGDWLFWRPTPGVRDAKALGVVWTGSWQGPTSVRPRGVSYPNLEDLRAATTTLDGLAGVQEGDANLAVADEAPEPAQVAWVTSGYFQVLGVRLVAGRGFVPDDDRPPYGQPVAVVSATLARRAFGSPAEALGRSLTLNGRRLTVVGVTDPAFNGQTPLSRVAVWYPGATYSYVNRYAANDAQAFATRGRGLFYSFVVRLAPGATFPAAQAQLDAVVPGLAVAYPDDNGAWRTARARLFPGLGPEPLQRPGFRTMIAGLLVLGGILLLLGCANITNLLLVRELRRHRERAIRLALGASRRRLMQAQLVESMLLAVAGGAVGVVVAAGLNHLIESLLLVGPAGGTLHIPLNGRVLGASLGVAVVCGLAAGLIPAWIGSSTRLESALRQGDSRATSGGRRLRSLFGAVQFALSLALLTGAFLMIATLRQLHAVDLGFDPGGVSTYYLSLDRAGYDAASALSYDRELIDQLSAAPAITTALSYTHPFGPTIGWSLETSAETNDRIRVNMNGVTADYFRVLGVPLVRGRGFSSDEALQAGDHEGMPAVLSESLARRFFAEANPLGRQIVLAGRSGVPASRLTVIGVVGDVHWRGITESGRSDAVRSVRAGGGGHGHTAICAARQVPPTVRGDIPVGAGDDAPPRQGGARRRGATADGQHRSGTRAAARIRLGAVAVGPSWLCAGRRRARRTPGPVGHRADAGVRRPYGPRRDSPRRLRGRPPPRGVDRGKRWCRGIGPRVGRFRTARGAALRRDTFRRCRVRRRRRVPGSRRAGRGGLARLDGVPDRTHRRTEGGVRTARRAFVVP